MKAHIINTIKELYEWAVKNGCENFEVFTDEEGISRNIIVEEMEIYEKEKEIYL